MDKYVRISRVVCLLSSMLSLMKTTVHSTMELFKRQKWWSIGYRGYTCMTQRKRVSRTSTISEIHLDFRLCRGGRGGRQNGCVSGGEALANKATLLNTGVQGETTGFQGSGRGGSPFLPPLKCNPDTMNTNMIIDSYFDPDTYYINRTRREQTSLYVLHVTTTTI